MLIAIEGRVVKTWKSTTTVEIKFLALILYPYPLHRSNYSVEHLLKVFLNEFVTHQHQ